MPKLPEREPSCDDEPRPWHHLTVAWWRDVWRSPMADQYLKADVHGLYQLAELIDRFWYEPSTTLRTEIRLSSMAYGLSPIDRRRLGWEVEEEQEELRRPGSPPKEGSASDAAVPVDPPDPRSLFSIVS